MVVEPESLRAGDAHAAVAALALGARRLAEGSSPAGALVALVEAAARATGAELAIARVVEPDGRTLVARAVSSASPALAAELEGTRVDAAEVCAEESDDLEHLPAATRRAAERTGATSSLCIPLRGAEEKLGVLELLRRGPPFDDVERAYARLAAYQLSVAVRALLGNGTGDHLSAAAVLALAGEALAAGLDESRTSEQVTRLAAEATGASTAHLWRLQTGDRPVLAASFGRSGPPEEAEAAERALRGRRPVAVEALADGSVSASLQLGQPPLAALQLLFPPGSQPRPETLAELGTFGVRAAHALRSSERTQAMSLELDRTRALLAVVGQAISQLSLAHTLETAVERVAELLGAERLAIYLRDEERRLPAAAGRGLAGPHVRVAERLLELTLGPFRTRGPLESTDVGSDPRLAPVQEAAAESGIEAAIGVPLVVRDDVIGLLAVYPPAGRKLTENESALLSALAAQLAVAVQNARLHEQSKLLGAELEQVLASERQAAKQLRALYEISRSFAQSLSLDETLDAVAQTIVELLDVDVAVIRMPDTRRERLAPLAMSVANPRLEESLRTILYRPQPLNARPIQRLFRTSRPFRFDEKSIRQMGGSHTLLLPFLGKGWTGAMVPIATPAEVLASLTILSVRPGKPIAEETIDSALAVAGQAALAIDNARLYQQQKDFSDTMQRSLLPRTVPELPGIELGAVYESSARVDVGGDVYDYITLADGRLAVVLGDVTGHGIEAAADMAMAKFVFRSLAREHPEPGAFLSAANDVVVGEIAPGKFITMLYMTIDPSTGEVAAACAGHPEPRLVSADGVRPLEAHGLVLGVADRQEYAEVRERLEEGSAVVLYTDGVVEARREGELYGEARLDALLWARRDLSPLEVAEAVVADCRAFAGGELTDDCAVVVIKKTA